ncbi:signal-induced proliferation-associated 1-like protein 2 isoform X2 [Dreissena polymorpha]|uniref:signal-induced proliferation-associated 1-like protein 2 isoform X2 n=1 Tax=Dreissena polymorpha TaxID=45954 RepID=UPI002263FA9D|nr:signal-induced proliferation-associated 1-like protein 2 isoform X2 [Dreissena polymorpha]
MSEELIPPFTGPMSQETAQYRAKQAVDYYHKQVKIQNKPELPKRNNRDRQDVRDLRDQHEQSNGYHSQYESKNVNLEGRYSAQAYSYDTSGDSHFVRGGHRATVHGTDSLRQREHFGNGSSNNDYFVPNNRQVPREHHTGSKKRYSRGLHRSNSNLEESLEYINVDNLDTHVKMRKAYGSTSSLDIMNASTSSDSFFKMVENLKPSNTDQRSPAPSKLQEVLRGPKAEDKDQTFMRNLEQIANGSVINNRPLSVDSVDAGGQSPLSRKKDRKLRSKSITPDVGSGVLKRFRGKNDNEQGGKNSDAGPDLEIKGDDRFRRKAFVHYDSQSVAFDINKVVNRKKSVTNFSNISTGASAASGTRESFAGDAETPDIVDNGDGHSNDLVHSCSFFRNEIGGEEDRIIGLTQSTASKDVQLDRIQTNSAIIMNRSPDCCGITILDCSPTSGGHIIPPHTKHRGHVIEYVDTGANYYRHFFYNQEHQNYFGIDDNFGPLAVSVKREKLEERGNNLGKSEPGLFQYRIILRTSELHTLRGSVLEDAIPASGRLSSSRGIPVKDILEFLVPDVQTSCLRQGTSVQKTWDQLLKLDEQRIFNTYKIGIMLCRAGQTTEEEMYNNEYSTPAFDEFLSCIGEKVRLKGFEKYRAQLDNKTDSTGTHSVYTTFNNSEIMFHVSTLLPFTPKNSQQLLRKRHIGNDIVTIVFQEAGAPPFTPKSVRSQFQHVFIVIRAHNPCTEKTMYSIAVTRSKDVPPFGPHIPDNARFYKSKEFSDFLLAKVINAENAAHHSEKFSAMAVRTRQEYLKDLSANHVTSNSLESASKLSKFAMSGKKKDKNKLGKVVPDNFAAGAIVWMVKVEDVSLSKWVLSFLGIAAETLVIVEESTGDVIFTTHCGAVIGWTSQAVGLRLYYGQGDCLDLQPHSGDMEELQEIVTRLQAVTPGCQTEEYTLKRNKQGQLGFHIQAEGVVTDVEPNGHAFNTGLRKGSRLVEICKVSSVTLTHDQMVDLLRTSATVKVVVIPPLDSGCPRDFSASEMSLIQETPAKSSHHSKNPFARDSIASVRDSFAKDSTSTRESNLRVFEEKWELREITRADSKDSKDMAEGDIQEELEFIHERESSISSSQSHSSQRSTHTLPHPRKTSSSSDHRGETHSPPNRMFYLTADNGPWATSSLPRGVSNITNLPGFHGYQDSVVSSGRGSLFEGRETGNQYGSSSGGLDDSSYGTLEDRHKKSGSRDSLDQAAYGGSRDWPEPTQPRRPPPPREASGWGEGLSSSTKTYLTSSSENLYPGHTSHHTAVSISSSQSAPLLPPSSSALSLAASRKLSSTLGDPSTSVQHGNFAQELLKQSQNTKYLLSQGNENSRREIVNSSENSRRDIVNSSANSSSVNLSDTSFSSGGSAQGGIMPQQGAHAARDRSRDDSTGRRRANTASGAPHGGKTHTSGLGRMAELSGESPQGSEPGSPRSSQKNLSGMSSEESLSTRLRPGVTSRVPKSRATNNLQDDLMRLIDPDLAENDLSGLLATESRNRRLSGRLVRTMSDESLHSGKGGPLWDTWLADRGQYPADPREALRKQRLSPRGPSDEPARVPMPESTASLDWSSLVDVATKAIGGGGSPNDSKERITSPVNSTVSSASSNSNLNKTRSESRPEVKVESLYRQKNHDRPPDPPTASNPPVWRPVVANPQQKIHDLEVKVQQLEEELQQERQESAALDGEVQRLRTENARLQEESQNAAAQLRKFTEWFFTTIDRQ